MFGEHSALRTNVGQQMTGHIILMDFLNIYILSQPRPPKNGAQQFSWTLTRKILHTRNILVVDANTIVN